MADATADVVDGTSSGRGRRGHVDQLDPYALDAYLESKQIYVNLT